MAQYDGAIRIDTQIRTKQAQIQLMSLQNRIIKTADKIASLRSKMDSLKDAKIPTQEYSVAQKEVDKYSDALQRAKEKIEKLLQLGAGEKNSRFASAQYDVAQLEKRLLDAEDVVKRLESEGKAFSLGSNSEEFKKLSQQLKYVENDYRLLIQRKNVFEEKHNIKSDDGYVRLKKSLEDLYNVVSKVVFPFKTLKSAFSINDADISGYDRLESSLEDFKNNANVINGLLHPFQSLKVVASSAIKGINNMFSNMKSAIKKVTVLLSKMGAVIKRIGGFIIGVFKKGASFIGSFAGKIKELAASSLIFNQISAAFRAMFNGMKEGFENLYAHVDDFRLRVNTLRASCLTLKNTLAGAFRPLVEIAIPYIQKAVEYITMLVGNLGQLFAALTGQNTYTKAIKMTADYFEKEEKAAKKAKKAIEGYLNPLDEINKYTKNQKEEDNNLDESQAPMFEEVPIEGHFKEMAKKIKDVLKKIFKPLKEAWNREGKFVMDSWKYALKEIGKLAKDIGRDFLKVWQQPATVDMLADMLHILGGIGLVVGNIAGKFREAWNYNNTGLHILENIRDIFAVIIHNIREAVDYTVEWTKTLDFRPLLTSVENVTHSFIRFADFMSGTLADFYTQFILPLVSWTLSEQGLPRLFNILAAFMNEINWEGLRSALKNLYQALEPYAEEIGAGLIDFIEKMKNEGVEFFNFLPGAIQRAADALRKGDLPAAFYEFGSIFGEAVKHAFNVIKIAIESIPWGEIGTSIASFINGIPWGEVTAALFGALSAAITGAIDFLYNLFTTIRWEDIGHAFGENLQRAWSAIDWQKAGEMVGAGIKGILDFLLATVQELDWAQIGRDIGTFLSEIPWLEIFSQVFEIVWEVLSGLIFGLLDTESGKIITAIGAGILAIKGLFNVADFALTVAQWATGGTDKFALLSKGAELLKSNLGNITSLIGALFSPTGLMIAGIIAGALLIITHWDKVSEALDYLWNDVLVPFREFVSTVFTSLWKDILSPVLEYLSNTVLPILSNTFENLWNNVLVPLGTFIGSVLKPVIEILSQVLTVLWKNIVVPLAQFLGTVFAGAFEIIAAIFNNIVVPGIKAIIDAFQFLWDRVLSPLVSFVANNLLPVFFFVRHPF